VTGSVDAAVKKFWPYGSGASDVASTEFHGLGPAS
jgi:hypothetical protein